MTLRELKDHFKVYFDIEKAKRNVTLELADMTETTLLLEGLIMALSQLGAYAEKTLDCSVVYPPNTELTTVELPADFGMIKQVLYYDNEVPAIQYQFSVSDGKVYLNFIGGSYLSDELIIKYYVFGKNLFEVIPSNAGDNEIYFSTYTDNFIIPIDNKALLVVIFATLSLIFPDLEAQFMRQANMVRSVIPKPASVNVNTQSWRL